MSRGSDPRSHDHGGVVVIRRLFLALLAAALLSTGAPAYAASPPTTETSTQKGVVETFVEPLPTCDEGDGALYRITTTARGVFHETTFPDGRVHTTFTQTGTFVAVPLTAGLPTYTGRFTATGSFNLNRKTETGSFKFRVRGTGSDGSTLSMNAIDHFTQRPNGSVRQFFRCH